LPHIHIGLHCNANEKNQPQKGLLSYNVLQEENWFNWLSSSSIVLFDCAFSFNTGSEPGFGERNHQANVFLDI